MPSHKEEQNELESIAAEFPEFSTILAGASFGAGKWKIEGEDPKLRYYFAAPGSGRPDSVEAVKDLGYRVSENKHNCPDLVLMETPQALYDLRKKEEREGQRQQLAALKRKARHGDPGKGLEPLRSDGGTPGFQKLRGVDDDC